jgi:iron complex outermembrane receptor protein
MFLARLCCGEQGIDMSGKSVRFGMLGAALSALTLVDITNVEAQDGAAGLDEIVVTARKKEEDLQSVPLSISAFTAEDIENRGIQSLEDLARQTPSLEFASSGAVTSRRPIIRGLAQQTRVGDEVNVSTFVDGVYTPGFSGTTSILFDAIERVEVIRGPQSAVYGRNSFAGAINYITKKPGAEFDLGFRGTYGTHHREALSGFITGPVVGDALALRLDGGFNRTGGTLKNSLDGSRLNGAETTFVRLGLRSQIGERVEINASIMRQDDDLEPAAQTVIPRNDSRRVGKPDDGVSPFELFYALETTGMLQTIGRRTLGEMDDQNGTFVQDLLAGGERETTRGALNIDFNFGAFTLTSLTGYQDRETLFFSDLDETAEGTLFTGPGLVVDPIISQTGSGPSEDRDEFSQDLRLQYDAGGAINASVGLYYSDEEFTEKRWRWGDPPVSTSNAILPAPPPQVDTESILENEFASVYGAFEISLAEDWKFSAEGRYTSEEKSATQLQDNFPSNSVPIGDLGTRDFDYFTPRFIVSFNPYDDGLLYVQAAKGVKSGGFNPNAGISLEEFANLPPDEQERFQGAQDEQTYDTEENWTYEFGGKFTFWEGRAQVNAAIYYVEWTNQQILTLSTDIDDPELALSASNPILGNVAESESQGLELEAIVVPTEWLTVNLGYAYADPKYKDAVFGTSAGWDDCTSVPILDCDENGESTGRVDGNRLQNTSKNTFNAGLEIQSPINERGWLAFMRGDYLHRSRRFTDAENVGWVPEANVVNLRLGVRSDAWTVEGFCNNLLEEDAPTFGFASRDFFGVPNFTVVNREGRMCGLTIAYNRR